MVVLNSSQIFWSFDTPESPGSVSIVFADNQSEKQFLQVWNGKQKGAPKDVDKMHPSVCTDSLTIAGPTGRNPMDLCGTLTGMHGK